MAAKSASPDSIQILGEIGFGHLPDQWEIVRLEDLLSTDRGISVGVMYPGSHDPEGVPLIKAGDLANGSINPRPDFRITREKHLEYRRTELIGGELLISLVGEVGRCAVVGEEMAGWNAARAVAVLRFVDPADAYFVLSCLMSAPLQYLMNAWATTTVQATLNLKEIRQIPIPWPTETERRKIASILGSLEDKIELNRRMNETLDAMARALFKSWFVDFDPVRAKAEGLPSNLPPHLDGLFPGEFENSTLGDVPKGWSPSTLGHVTTKIGSGATPRGGSAVYVDEGVALIRSQNVYDSQFVWDGLARLTDTAAAELNGVTVRPNDILLNITGASILRTCIVELDVLPARVNQHVCIIRSRPDMPARYLHFHLLQQSTKDYLMGMDAGASRQAVTKGHIESVPLLVPPVAVLRQFETLISPIFDAVDNHNAQIRTLTALRDTLLPKLISGELRVKAAEKMIEAVA